MSTNTNRIRRYYLANCNKSIKEIAKDLQLNYDTIARALEKKDLFIVPSLNEENLYFIFNGILEKELKVDLSNAVLNEENFNSVEKTFIRSYGFKL